jgi:UDP:flavonoid glycosyltransferase YjiC (YdhE family)
VEEIRRNIEEVLTNEKYLSATRRTREVCGEYASGRVLEETISSILNDTANA